MNNNKKALLFIHDYTEQGNDLFYLWDGAQIGEVTAEKLVTDDAEIICHDYWLIAPAIYRTTQQLPKIITDVEELRISTSGKKTDRELKEKTDIAQSLKARVDADTIKKYLAIFHRKSAVDDSILTTIGQALLELSEEIEILAKKLDEWDRFIKIERPITEQLIQSAAKGIAINEEKLRLHKKNIEFDYYMTLKSFSSKYNVPLEIPSDAEIINYLEPKGYDFSGVNVDYVLKFVPMQDDFAIDLLKLMKIAKSRKVLNLIPLSQRRIYPITDVFGSVTSRIYFKDPSLQNLAKQHRNILAPDKGKLFSYVDFDQYEAGIMGILSGDSEILRLYASGDLYETVAEEVFGNKTNRKEAKRLFLSYAYGMRKQSLYDAASNYGANRQAAKDFFNKFSVFEKWKVAIHSEFQQQGYVKTSLGNHMQREIIGPLSEQEKRSSVSQIVQGTASLIFKKTLLNLRSETNVQIKVPMHDAVLFQHDEKFNAETVAQIFSSTMTEHFEGKIQGKASISEFFEN
ncbi:DNA polymerase I [Pseudomonas tensinigenes]|uniref:DNA polymerase I n=1 Tax=Pseudomonas tensinigenes TaxID=2745511 RepID=A0ABX8PQT6_9PSED|nr:DNA polymerase [Pseudomonas tensinigenes]QXI03744.1 DNA polymerase I [Pseudomonas tensinigenes]